MLPINDKLLDTLLTLAAAATLLRSAQKAYEETPLPLHLKRKLELERLIDKWIKNLQWSATELNLIEATLS